MQATVVEVPYKYVPPLKSFWWPTLIGLILHRYLRKTWGIHSIECRNAQRLRASIERDDSVILAPNHCRLCDPMVLGVLSLEVEKHFFAMASWHLFNESWFNTFMIRRMGAFSVYREGNDRQSVNEAITILTENSRPLIIFPEGAVSRHADLLQDLMDGPSFIARQAAKRRAKVNPDKRVVIHPVAIRYAFMGDLVETIAPILSQFEKNFTWPDCSNLTPRTRIKRIGHALLAIKEVEYFGSAREGDLFDRVESLVEEILSRLEDKWDVSDRSGGAVSRVKRIRTAIMPDLVEKKVTAEEYADRWRDLSACYYVQQIDHYPRNYLEGDHCPPERILETIERFEEDFTDKWTKHEPLHAVIDVGEAIPVSSQRDRSATTDPITAAIRTDLEAMLGRMAAERPHFVFS